MVTIGIIPYKHFLIILPVLLLFVINKKAPFDLPFFILCLLISLCIVSTFVNQGSMFNLLLFFRNIVSSYLVYYLFRYSRNSVNWEKIENWVVLIMIIQLPIVLIQQATYEFLPSRIISSSALIPLDYDFGTFKFKGDPDLSFFLCLFVIHLIFNERYNPIKRFGLSFYATISIFIVNSQVNHLLIIVIWAVYLLRNFFSGQLSALKIVGTVVFASAFIYTGVYLILDKLIEVIGLIDFTNASDYHVNLFLKGEYSRLGAVLYYIDRGIIWIGDGPGAYFNPVTDEYILGNTGHLFTFYSEIGFIGLTLSYFFVVSCANKFISTKNNGLAPKLILLSLLFMSLTTFIYSDITFLFLTFVFLCLTPYNKISDG